MSEAQNTEYALVTRGAGSATHIAHAIRDRTWCYCPLGNFHPLPSRTRAAGKGEPTCKTCRKLAGLS